MKRKNIIIMALIVLSGILTMQSCKVDDTTFTEEQAFTQPVATSPVVNPDGTLFFTGSTVDLAWASENSAGDPVKWNVYFGTGKSPALVESDYNQQTLTVEVLDGQTYYWRVEIVDNQGIKTSSDTWSFTSVDGSSPKMNVALTTTTDVASSIGVDLAPKDVVDMKLIIVDPNTDLIVASANTAKSADALYENFKTLPDGDYIVGVELVSTKDFGDVNSPVTLDFTLNFAQLGIINTTYEYAGIMTNEFPCSVFRTYMAKVTKAGSVYTLTREVSYVTPAVVTWFGTDESYPSEVTTSEDCSGLTISGLNFGWMLDFWGETVVEGGTVIYTVDGSGNIDIPNQWYIRTTWRGALQPPYYIEGTGTLDESGAFPVMHIEYHIIQNGWDLAADYGTGGVFTADLTLDPAKKKSTFVPREKPVRD